jgi:lincosamide nucleotidyltransferase A/C/D/E
VNLSAQAAVELYESVRGSGIRCWVMGGWGVDALVGVQTREHHDLDVLVLGEDLRALADLFEGQRFEVQHVWEAENRWLDVDGATWPTAFVAGNEERVELDVHVIELRAGVAVLLCDVPWPFDASSLEGRGVISGRPVDCVSAPTQLAMHRGYELPEAQQRDIALLRQLV